MWHLILRLMEANPKGTVEDMPPGIPNIGNTCYLSCILQVMTHCLPVTNSIRTTQSEEFKTLFQKSFRRLFCSFLQGGSFSEDELGKFTDVASKELGINLRQQQDFFEVFKLIVEHLPNSIQDVCLNSIYSCEHIDNDRGFQCSDSKEYRIFEIPTARRHDGVTDLNSMLWSYFHATIETPEKIIRSTRFITNFVRIFPISLPLFEENGTVNELPVTVKSHIDISKFDLTRTEYDLELYGVLYHSKSIGHGHYAISLKIKNRWFNFNDDRVTVECRNIPKKMDGMCIVGLL